MSFRRRVYETLTNPAPGDRLGNGIFAGVLLLIVVNVLVSMLETVPALGTRYPRFFFWFEAFSVAVFTIEYVARLWSCTSDPAHSHPVRGRWKMMLQPMAIVDLVAILPFYLQVFLPGMDLRFVRVLRLFRIFRIFRAGGLAAGVGILATVLRTRRSELIATFTIMILFVTLSANVIYLAEHRAQPDRFASVPDAMWWAVVTITTIGYGDLFPVTPVGRMLGGLLGFLGVVMIALPIGVLGSGFVEEVERRKSAAAPLSPLCPHCGLDPAAPLAAPAPLAGTPPEALDASP